MPRKYEPVESPDETTIFPYHDLTAPTTADVYDARKRVRRFLPRTPLVRSENLSELLNADVLLKREDTLPTGAFKVRGGVNLGAQLSEEFRETGLIAASTGNHGQSVAYAGRLFDVPVVIAVPEEPNPDKVVAMERYGATVVSRGRDYDEAREWAERRAAEERYRYVHSANEPALVAGVGTAGIEVIEDRPDVDIVFCPVGGGSSASGYCLTVGEILDADVVGVQAAGADATYRGWKEGHLDSRDSVDTIAEGIASRVPFALTMEILREKLDDMLRVSDRAIEDALRSVLLEDHIQIEGASAAAVAGAIEAGTELEGKTVVIQLSGRNIPQKKVRRLLDSESTGG